jgi:Protein of unknown function (DUF3631)
MVGKIHSIEEVISGAELLDDVFAFVKRFVALSKDQAVVVACWIVHTHCISAASHTAYLAIGSAEKQSGKSRLLEVLAVLVLNPWMTGRVSAAALIRKIDKQSPTLLLDETDAAFAGEQEYSEVLRGVLNSGFQRGGVASCCDGANHDVRDFKTFSAKALAGLGELPTTIADRSIPIRLKRAMRTEPVEKFRARMIRPEADGLRDRISGWSRWAIQNLPLEPTMHESLNDRTQDGAEQMFAIAELAGGSWPESLGSALVEIMTGEAAEDASIGVTLLRDIRECFLTRGVEKIQTQDLLFDLNAMESSPWAEIMRGGKPITANKLAALLRKYGIRPHDLRMADCVRKGYEAGCFADSWDRYLAPAAVPRVERSATAATCDPNSLFLGDLPELKRSATFSRSATKNGDYPD